MHAQTQPHEAMTSRSFSFGKVIALSAVQISLPSLKKKVVLLPPGPLFL